MAGGRPDIDTGQLEKANKLMSDIVSKFDTLARFDEIPALRLLPKHLDDVDKKLSGINKMVDMVASKGGQKKWKEFTAAIKSNRKEHENLKKELHHINNMQKERGKLTNYEKVRIKEIVGHMRHLNKELREELDHKEAFGKLAKQEGGKFFDYFGGSMMTMGFSTVFAGLKMITSGIEKFYDLQEKIVASLGNFRRTIGPATAATDDFEKVITDTRDPLQKLGFSFEESAQRMGDFIKGFGYADKQAKDLSKTAIYMSVAMGVGAGAVGELQRTMQLMGMESAKSEGALREMVVAANASGVSVAQFSEEMVGAKESIAEFGTEGRKMFLGAAAWAKKLGVSIKSLQNIIKLTDTFESAATAAAKMNTVFGTSINSMDLMLEQDPAKRFNMLRDSMIGAGKEMKNLSRLEKKMVADTLGMSIEETNAFLASGKDYNKFMAEKAEMEQKAAENTKWMNDMMAKARNTLYNWRLLGQKVIEKLQPLVDLFLKGMGPGFENMAKSAQTFGDKVLWVVDEIVSAFTNPNDGASKVIEDLGRSTSLLFNEILDSKNVKSFIDGIKGIFTMFGRFVNWLTQLAASPAIKFISWIVEKLGEYGHIIAGAWAGAKAGFLIGGPPGALAGALLGGGAAAVMGSISNSAADQDTKIKAKQAANPGMSRVEALNAVAADEEAAAASSTDQGMWTGGGFGAHQPITVGEHGQESIIPATGGAVIPGNGLTVAAAAPIVLSVHLDSREIQRIPFNTAFPVNVSVVGA